MIDGGAEFAVYLEEAVELPDSFVFQGFPAPPSGEREIIFTARSVPFSLVAEERKNGGHP